MNPKRPILEYNQKASFKPVVGKSIPNKKPILEKTYKDNKWSFSFEYFDQIKYFGLGDTDTKWFIALIERLKDLSKQKVDLLLTDYTLKDAYRFHPINWNAQSIPMQRMDFDWLDKNILENEEEYPFLQFQISQALGRVVGYFDENHKHFYIILLDHKHNIQPSQYNDYNLDDTTHMYCDYTSFLIDIDRIKGMKCPVSECKCKKELNYIPTKAGKGKFVYFKIEDEYYEEFIIKTKDKSLKEIFELGLLST